MKKIVMIAAVCFGSAVAFGQTQPITKEQAKSPEALKMSAIADTMLVDKKAVTTDDSKKKKPRKERSHKECSRMKS